MNSMPVESAVQKRYAAAAQTPEAALCCPVQYNAELLKIIPEEVIAKDYGCGDPSRHLRPGETVLDLGSGTGKICFIAAQVVGPAGCVIGVDMTDDMLAVARRNAPIVAGRLGYANVEFRKGRIQDLALDLEAFDAALRARPVSDVNAFLLAEELAAELRARQPLVASASVDVVVSNCVLNLVSAPAKRQLFAEIFRVLRPGGRAVISDIVSDADVPEAMQADPQLWSGCISGALREDQFIRAFEAAGFHGIRILERGATPWRVVQGIAFRSVTVEAFKAPPAAASDALDREVIYQGPFREVVDDAGRHFRRGERVAVTARAWETFRRAPYLEHLECVAPSAVEPGPGIEASTGGSNAASAKGPPAANFRLPPLPDRCGNGSTCC